MRFYQIHKKENNMILLILLVGLGKEEMDNSFIIKVMELIHLKIWLTFSSKLDLVEALVGLEDLNRNNTTKT